MIITKSWLQEWIDIQHISTEELCKTLNDIGLEVDSVVKYRMPDNCVVGYVKTKKQHHNAEKLSICEVDVGEKANLQIVCGAKNVDEGQFVTVALAGAVLPDGITIKNTILRGVESCGMICSSTELGLPKTNDGILVLGNDEFNHSVGTQINKIVELNDDIIEIGLTPNRGDCLSVYGVARDLSAAFNIKLKQKTTLADDLSQVGIGRVLDLTVEKDIDSSLLYKVYELKNIKEDFIVSLRLSMVGIQAQTILEQYIAYATHATGVILRAYKSSIFNKDTNGKINIVAKKDQNGFDSIYSYDSVSIVGISQDINSKASDVDKTIIVEASYTKPEYLAEQNTRSIKTLDNTLYRSSRGSEPDLCFGVNFLGKLLNATSHVDILVDNQQYTTNIVCKKINVNIDDIYAIIGREIPKNNIFEVLKNLGFDTILKPEQNLISISVPSFRHDVANKYDICEEIVRIIGINNIPSKHLVFLEQNRINKSIIDFEKRKFYRYKAVSVGFYESIHYVFDNKNRVKKYNFECLDDNIDLVNPITVELNTLRSTLSLNLLEAVSKNIKIGKKSVMLFELGRVFNKKREESLKMTFVANGFIEQPMPQNCGKPKEFSFFTFVQAIKQVIGEFSISKNISKTDLFSPYEYGEIIINNQVAGVIGRLNLENDFDLEKAYICELDFDKLPYERKIARPYSKFQNVTRDLSLLVRKNLPYDEIKQCIKSCHIEELISFNVIDIYSDEKLGDKDSLTISLSFQSMDKTLLDEDINKMINNILQTLKNKLGIVIR